jgi:hypothetical protein
LKVSLVALVLHELDAVEVSVSADVPDDGQVVQLLERGAEGVLGVEDVLVQTFTLENVEVRHRYRRGHRVATERVAVDERRRALGEWLEEPVRRDHRAERGVARRQALAQVIMSGR